jgi:probable F420-dependent oxidoreductase
MRIGMQLAQGGQQACPPAVRASARAAETLGFDSIWVIDRLLAPLDPRVPYPAAPDGRIPAEQTRVLDPLTALTYAAACTETVRLGTAVLVGPWYRPLSLARALTSVDVLSDGRLDVGLGVGWSVDEYDAVGVPMRGLGTRQEELLDVLDVVWRPGPSAYQGATVDLRPADIGLLPVQRPRPRVLLAAYTPSAMDRVARRADGWIPAGIPVEMLALTFASIRDAAAGYGRDPDRLELVVRANIALTEKPVDGERMSYRGDLEQVVEDLEATRAAGAHEVVLAIAGDRDVDEEIALQSKLLGALR